MNFNFINFYIYIYVCNNCFYLCLRSYYIILYSYDRLNFKFVYIYSEKIRVLNNRTDMMIYILF